MIRDSMFIAANMTGANFDQASLHRADFTLAKWDNSTTFPKGFDPNNIEFLDVGVLGRGLSVQVRIRWQRNSGLRQIRS